MALVSLGRGLALVYPFPNIPTHPHCTEIIGPEPGSAIPFQTPSRFFSRFSPDSRSSPPPVTGFPVATPIPRSNLRSRNDSPSSESYHPVHVFCRFASPLQPRSRHSPHPVPGPDPGETSLSILPSRTPAPHPGLRPAYPSHLRTFPSPFPHSVTLVRSSPPSSHPGQTFHRITAAD